MARRACRPTSNSHRQTFVDFRLDAEPAGEFLVANDAAERAGRPCARSTSPGPMVSKPTNSTHPRRNTRHRTSAHPNLAGVARRSRTSDGPGRAHGGAGAGRRRSRRDDSPSSPRTDPGERVATESGVATDDGVIEADTTIVAGGPGRTACSTRSACTCRSSARADGSCGCEPEPYLVDHLIEAPARIRPCSENGSVNGRPTARAVAGRRRAECDRLPHPPGLGRADRVDRLIASDLDHP